MGSDDISKQVLAKYMMNIKNLELKILIKIGVSMHIWFINIKMSRMLDYLLNMKMNIYGEKILKEKK